MIKKYLCFMALAIGVVFSTYANAALVKIEGTVQSASVRLAFNDIVPIGTPVLFSLILDVGDGLPQEIPDINLINGSLTWEDNGEQVVNLIPQPPVEIVSELFNFYRLSFAGNGPTIGRFSLTGGALDLDFGVNLQTTNSDLIDLLLADSAMARIGLRVTDNNGTGTGLLNTFFTSDVKVSSVSDVPLPATLPMFLCGVFGLASALRRRKTPDYT